MPSTRRCPAPSLRIALLAAAFVLLLATPSPALALGDWVGVEGMLWHQGQAGQASIDGNILSGTTLDFQDTLDLEKTDNSKMGRVWFRFGKSRLLLDYFDSSRKGDTTLTQSFVFDDTLYAAGQTMSSRLDLKVYQAQYRFTVADLKLVEVGVGLTLNEAKINFALDGSVGGRTSLDKNVPYPTLGAAVTVKPFPGFHIRVEANGMHANVSGTQVQILDARAQVEWYVAHVLGFFAGYRTYRFNVDDQDFGSVDNTFKGPYAGIGVKF